MAPTAMAPHLCNFMKSTSHFRGAVLVGTEAIDE